MQPIFLTGFMGAGKTTVGCLLADMLCLQFVDTDRLIEEELGMSIAEIFVKNSNDFFREAENKILRRLAARRDTVIATGGGMPCYENNLEIIKSCGTSFYIKWKQKDLFHRLKIDGVEKRPLLAGKTDREFANFIARELKKRKTFYEQADCIVCGEDDEIIARKIALHFRPLVTKS
ncbi:MAG: shikimate kinase [Prevotellaceae bacterium]|jgi:shikimate kinase|nr:shikimate kinase [Prevotellaceae bacterium]